MRQNRKLSVIALHVGAIAAAAASGADAKKQARRGRSLMDQNMPVQT
jgi:uncharacterized membrane-anchored protein